MRQHNHPPCRLEILHLSIHTRQRAPVLSNVVRTGGNALRIPIQSRPIVERNRHVLQRTSSCFRVCGRLAITVRRNPTMKNAWKLVSALILLASLNCQAAEPGKPKTAPSDGGQAQMRAGTGRYGCSEKDIAHYVCRRAAGQITIDGRLDEPSWEGRKVPAFC